MNVAQIALVLTHIIAFATGYYLCLKNIRPKQKLSSHGISPEEEPEERISPRPKAGLGEIPPEGKGRDLPPSKYNEE